MSIATQIERINTAKAEIKEVVNQDFEKIQDETLTYYPEKIAEVIEEYKKYIPEKKVSGTEINISDAAPFEGKITVKGNTEQANRVLPEGYTQVDYIESNGTQYINTGVIPTFNTEVEVEFMSIVENMSGFIYGSRKANNDSAHTFIFFANAKDYYPQFADDSSVIRLVNTHPEFAQPNTKYKAKNGKNGFYINDVLLKEYTAQTRLDSTHSMYIFALNENGSVESRTAKARIYKFKIYENDVLIRDYVPCYRNSDNEVGLYDIVNNVFYTNQGTGAFTYGAVVDIPNQDYPQDIQVVTGNNVIEHVGKNLLDLQNKTGSTITLRKLQKKLIAGTYVFSCDDANKPIAIRLSETNKTGTKSKAFTTNAVINGRRYVTGTIDFDAEYVNLSSTETAITNMQLEEGSTPTLYEPYTKKTYNLNLGNMELCKIGDYQDALFKNVVGDENYNAELESGAWYKLKKINNILLDDNCSYSKGSTKTSSFSRWYTTPLEKALKNDDAYIISQIYANKLIGISMYKTYALIEGISYNLDSSGNLCFYLDATKEMTYNQVAQYMKLNPIKVYYIKKEPTYTKITDTTLISQLEALRKAKWFKGVNHWWTETENLEPVLEGTYKQALNESEVEE